MTDKEIGKTFREIAERGNTAEVKKARDGGVMILEVRKRIVKSDGQWGWDGNRPGWDDFCMAWLVAVPFFLKELLFFLYGLVKI